MCLCFSVSVMDHRCPPCHFSINVNFIVVAYFSGIYFECIVHTFYVMHNKLMYDAADFGSNLYDEKDIEMRYMGKLLLLVYLLIYFVDRNIMKKLLVDRGAIRFVLAGANIITSFNA